MCVLFFCVTLWEIERTLAMRLGLWDSTGRFFSHRTHRYNRTFLRTVSIPQNASGIQNSQNVIAKGGCKVLWVLPPARALWNTVCSVHLCYSVRKSTHPRYEMTHKQITVKDFLSQSTQSSRSFLAHISSPQNASGIQRTQSVSAIVDTNKEQRKAYILLIGVSRWSLPFPSGEGKGEGPAGEGGGATSFSDTFWGLKV